MAIRFEQTQKQATVVTQQLIQSVEILQMTTQELTELIYNEAIDNPVIEMETLNISELREKIDWLSRQKSTVLQNKHTDDEGLSYFEKQDISATTNTLQNHLLAQLYSYDLTSEQTHIAKYLIACIDPKGYLDEDIFSTAEQLNTTPAAVEEVISLLRRLTPNGVCARNLQHCLELQLEKLPENQLAIEIVRNHMDALGKCHYSSIAKKLKTTTAKVRETADLIRSLAPIPSSGFDSKQEVCYSFPDAYITEENGILSAHLYKSYIPFLKIDKYYSQLYANTDNSELKNYLDSKLKSAHWLIKCISQRESTLLSCLQILCEFQKSYFTDEHASLAPMTLLDVAEEMGVHPSTISRTIRGKNIYCCHGLIPIKSLFTQNITTVDSSNCSSDYVKARIINLINLEESTRPLSDQKISELLRDEKIFVSRRTITKYRESLQIGSTLERKSVLCKT